ncbi:MAG: hypothetical protein RR356_07400 [Bacteroidales bacterium]
MKKKRFLFLAVSAVTVIIAVVLLSNKKVVEQVKRNTAKLLVYEYIPNQHYDLSEREVTFKKDSLYTDFRRQYRFHYQTIGVAEFNDSSKLIMIAEPPPYFATDSLKSIFAKFTHSIEFKHHKIGYDGRATDLLISLANATCENVDHLIKRLSKELFLSDYKPAVTKLPVTEKKVYFSSSNLDYQITLYEFNEWFLENKEAFLDCRDTTQTLTIRAICWNRWNIFVNLLWMPI